MNCKQGDLAFLIKSKAGNEGKIVQCVKLARGHRFMTKDGSEYFADAWKIDRPLTGSLGGPVSFIPDAWLIPIRDQPGEDETLTWAGKPKTIKHDPVQA